jgi:hypothetical protein
MATTPVWGIPYIAEGQSSPETTHNAALNMLQMKGGPVQEIRNGPPGLPIEGQVFIVGTVPTGAYVGHANALAGYFGGAWTFLPGRDDDGTFIPMGSDHAGLTCYNVALDEYSLWDGAAWVSWGFILSS